MRWLPAKAAARAGTAAPAADGQTQRASAAQTRHMVRGTYCSARGLPLRSFAMIRAAVVLTALSLFACNGCNGDGNTPPATGPGTPGTPGSPSGSAVPATGGETVIHAEDDGRTFDVARGSAVTFKLASNAGTGFQWSPAGVDANILSQQGDRGQELSSDSPGAPKMDVFHFRANAPGTTAVEMDLKRAFGTQPPGRVVHVTINVH